MPLSGSSTKLAAAIKKAGNQLNSTSKLPMQAHHLLASSVVIALDTEFYKQGKKGKKKRFAFASGYDLNGAPNGINLPIRFGHQKALTLVRHRGRHGPPYFTEIRTLLEPIYQDVLDKGKDVCPTGADNAAFLLDFEGAEKDVRSRLTGKNPTLWLYDKWSQQLWTGDYKDEGATVGKLRSPYGIVDDAAAGLEWDQKLKPMRRHTMTGPGKTAVLNATWYGSRGYPAPKWP
jgi:hypothetical protein